MRQYIQKLYESRYFWSHLARIELKNKFRRSKLGSLWTFVSPLCLTAIMSVVFATAFRTDIASYAPYVLSGILCWDVFSSSFITGSFSIISNDAYIRQFSHPITIYTLKSAIVYTISFAIALIALVLWILFTSPLNILVALFSLPMTFSIFFCFAWAGTTISAFMATKYRDYPQLSPLILQIFWYISPVFFQEEMFQSVPLLERWFQINPITHMLQLVRAPFLDGILPSSIDYLSCFIFTLIVVLLAVYINKKEARDIIFYI